MPDAKKEAERAWYGKTCARCEAPINYAQAAKSLMPGYCGKCIDELRRAIVAEARKTTGPGAAADLGKGDVAGGGGRGGGVVAGLILGLLLGFAAAVALAALKPHRFMPIVDVLKNAAGGG